MASFSFHLKASPPLYPPRETSLVPSAKRSHNQQAETARAASTLRTAHLHQERQSGIDLFYKFSLSAPTAPCHPRPQSARICQVGSRYTLPLPFSPSPPLSLRLFAAAPSLHLARSRRQERSQLSSHSTRKRSLQCSDETRGLKLRPNQDLPGWGLVSQICSRRIECHPQQNCLRLDVCGQPASVT